MCPKPSIVRGYVDLELAMGAVDRVRKLHGKQLELWPFNVAGWVRYAQLEGSLGEVERARGIFELAIAQPSLDMPEVVWKAFIDFEIDTGELDNARQLYEALLGRTQHLKVWMSYAAFEASVAGDAAAARRLYDRAHAHFKSMGEDGKESRALVLETWRAFEAGVVQDAEAAAAAAEDGGDAAVQAVTAARAQLSAVEAKLPKRVTKRRHVEGGGGVGAEYVDFVFPEDETKPAALKLLELAAKWKRGGSVSAVLGGTSGEAPAVGERRPRPHDDAGAGADGGAGDSSEPGGGVDDAAIAAAAGSRWRDAKAPRMDDGDGADPSHIASALLSSALAAGDAGGGLPQSVWREEGVAAAAGEDPAAGLEVERQLEDEVKRGGVGGGSGGGGTYVRDLFNEEDAGDKADRDL